MRFIRLLAAVVLLIELLVPIYWLIVHSLTTFWRKRMVVTVSIAGLIVLAAGRELWIYRYLLLDSKPHSWFPVLAGLTLIGVYIYLLVRVRSEMGLRRLTGQAELAGKGEMFAGGLYAHVRHPVYVGMFGAIVGAALIVGTPRLWAILAVWCVLALIVVRLEERELAARFGPAYAAYRKRVPAFLPLRQLKDASNREPEK
jgi:protein-S-isoprenylcysteine O-methyltransferase Ste14